MKMEAKTVTIALGHDALGTTLPEQKVAAAKVAAAVADLTEDGWRIVLTHSNGPQVGMIHTAMAEFHRLYPDYTATPMSVCSAMSQGSIGYDLQNAIRTELVGRGIYKPVSTILTQAVVDPYDDMFYKPIKVIGRVMTKDEAMEEEKKGNYVVEVENGYRRIFSAPRPKEIVEIDAIRALLAANQIVIAGGGGGIPVLSQGTKLQGASAVIEKDLTAGLLASEVDADLLLFLTDVPCVYRNFGTDQQTPITSMNCTEAQGLIESGCFEDGKMRPKIEAAIRYIGDSAMRRVLITRMDTLKEALEGKNGTVISK